MPRYTAPPPVYNGHVTTMMLFALLFGQQVVNNFWRKAASQGAM